VPHYTSSYRHRPVKSAFTIVKENRRTYGGKQRTRKYSDTTLLKRIPLERLMDLKIDYAFKQLFGKEENKAITVVFINSFLQKTGHEPITEISFNNSEESAEFDGDKSSRLDILAVTKNGEQINIEIQFSNQFNMVNRSIYYWAGLYRRQMKKGDAYDELKPVIAINIMNFNYFKQTNRFHTMYHLYEDVEKFHLTDMMEFHFVEIPKLIQAWQKVKLDPWNDALARWLLLLGIVDGKNGKTHLDILKELEAIAMNDEKLLAAFENWEELSMDDKEFAAYEGRMKQILDEHAAIRAAKLREERAEKRGLERGLEQGKLKSKKEFARRLLNMGYSIEEIAKMADMEEKQVLELKKELD
jgi:predicted transposase/invertase (TIGR01784 family)